MSELVRSKYDNNDALLNDWGIYHFHLTRQFRKDGKAKRSKYQIFTCCDEQTMYFLQIYPHNTENLYSKEELLRIVKDNWPHLLYALDNGTLTKKYPTKTEPIFAKITV